APSFDPVVLPAAKVNPELVPGRSPWASCVTRIFTALLPLTVHRSAPGPIMTTSSLLEIVSDSVITRGTLKNAGSNVTESTSGLTLALAIALVNEPGPELLAL